MLKARTRCSDAGSSKSNGADEPTARKIVCKADATMKVRLVALAATGGQTRGRAAIATARTRPWATLMASLAPILGVIPPALAAGAGAEMRQALGILVSLGMIGVSIFHVVRPPIARSSKRRAACGTRQVSPRFHNRV
ncbi:MAG: hypothetical protein DI565_16415 [Ancylobacter novellus]|uniref:Uncharacterized protein n=1 Tax=Ancylobacter novellus TaxID=921 RepID=A0A2W5K5E2_ANCNO|nr:MAG: hypothetical protein DI565_16415 [Ancylobacter novellus]